MAKKQIGKTYRVGAWKLKTGKQTVDKINKTIEDGDTLQFPSGVYDLRQSLVVTNSIRIEGKPNSIVKIPNAKTTDQKQSLHITSRKDVILDTLIFEIEPETNGINVAKTFQGTLTLNRIKTKHKRQILYQDTRKLYPSIRVSGSGTLIIRRCNLDIVAIDAPNMSVIVEQSTIGSFENSSLIRAKSISMIDSTVDNCQMTTPNAEITNLKTRGGLALLGKFELTCTELLNLTVGRPENYPKALTHIIGLPGSTVKINEISSSNASSPPYYRNFEFKGCTVYMNDTDNLSDQLLNNILVNSKVHTNSGKWLTDPTPAQLLKEQNKLTQAYYRHTRKES